MEEGALSGVSEPHGDHLSAKSAEHVEFDPNFVPIGWLDDCLPPSKKRLKLLLTKKSHIS